MNMIGLDGRCLSKNKFVDIFNIDGILVFSFIRQHFKARCENYMEACLTLFGRDIILDELGIEKLLALFFIYVVSLKRSVQIMRRRIEKDLMGILDGD